MFNISNYCATECSWQEAKFKIAFMWLCESFMQSKLWVDHDKFWSETLVLWVKLRHGSPHGTGGWHLILPMEKTLDPWTVGLADWWGPFFWINAQWRTAGSRRESLRRDPCGKGLGRHPEALAEQLNHNQIWKFKMKTKLGKLVKFMRSLEGETATVWGVVYVYVSCNYTLLSATLSQKSHYSHVLYPTLAVMFTTYPTTTEMLTVSFQHCLLLCIDVIAICRPYSQPCLLQITFIHYKFAFQYVL